MEFQDRGGRLLNTQEARKAFCSQYKDRLFDLAFTLTHDQKQSCNLVVAAFQHAFQKYTSTPCPDDSYPFLSSAIYLLFATGDETNDFCSDAANSDAGTSSCVSGEPTRARGNSSRAYADTSVPNRPRRPAPEYVAVQEEEPVVRVPEKTTFPAAAAAPAATTVRVSPPSAVPPRHAEVPRTDFSQPLSQQVFDPEHTDYWTPGMDDAKVASTAGRGARYTTVSPVPAAEPSGPNAPSLAGQSPQQPNISQDYMYDEKLAKKRKSPFLRIVNTLLFFLFVWMTLGLLIRMEVLPQWNLGYAWFNLYIYPLF